jgi:probable phosphoglycerate mutase
VRPNEQIKMTNLFSAIDPKNFPSTQKGYIFADGGSRGNPGKAGAGAVLYDENKQEIAHRIIPCGIQTNNFAEYTGLIEGMKLALEHGITDLEVRLDSKLAVEQMSGHWKVKNSNIRPLFEQGMAVKEQFKSIKFIHVPREKNKRADHLSNLAMDKV